MKFCLLSMDNRRADDEKKAHFDIQYSVNNWAEVMNGKVYDGPFFNQGEYGPDYEYFNEYDLVMIALRIETIEAGIKVKQRSKAKVVVFLDAEVDYFTSQTPRYLQAKMVELLNIVDAVAVLHDESIPFFRELTTRPVGLVGLPFPLEKVREMCPNVRKKEQIELGSSIKRFPVHNRNALVNLAALSEIGIEGVVDMHDPEEIEYLQSIKQYLPHLRIKFRVNKKGWIGYITRANYSLLGMHLDYRYTWGRFPAECAALRMPCVAPPSLYTQKTLFPRLCLPHYDIGGVTALVKRLVSDTGFYEETVSYAQSQIEAFSYDQCKKRLLNLIS